MNERQGLEPPFTIIDEAQRLYEAEDSAYLESLSTRELQELLYTKLQAEVVSDLRVAMSDDLSKIDPDSTVKRKQHYPKRVLNRVRNKNARKSRRANRGR